LLLERKRVQDFLLGAPLVRQLMEALSSEQAYVILCLPALRQAHIFANLEGGTTLTSRHWNGSAVPHSGV
jgi:hypothetical protein